MRKLTIIEHMSLDGTIQAGPGFQYGDWSGPYRSPEGAKKVVEMYGERCDVLLGRTTYDQFSAFWPHQGGPMAERLIAATKFVVTHRPESLAWGPAEALTGDLVEEVRRLKATDGPQLVMPGSTTLTSTLLANDLADELVVMINPVLLGAGNKLFAEGTPARALELVSSEALPTGIVVQRYRPAGGLKHLK